MMASRDALTISRASKIVATGKESLVPGKVEMGSGKSAVSV